MSLQTDAANRSRGAGVAAVDYWLLFWVPAAPALAGAALFGASRPASSERSEPATRPPDARTMLANGSIPLPPMPQKKVESFIAGALLRQRVDDKGEIRETH